MYVFRPLWSTIPGTENANLKALTLAQKVRLLLEGEVSLYGWPPV